MKLTLTALLLAPLALALDNSQALPEQELSDNSVAAGLASSDVAAPNKANKPNDDAALMNAAAVVCPVNYPYYCASADLCCPYNICCSRQCCAPDAQFCSSGLCYRYS
ncbi:uncharacterized protein B0T15DRAFT_47086 [Chaetomium strumarium]|uniref:Uncharacterized protein n=1 Tax=Chaetomium strumarium TaxID=1170767 RepID=A0AAJ0H2R9_9PEZI|nr:hypothetical protein B0T15DRAFT_47086 [Chaetomium strumarium]